jgi:asparagine synthetase B (glutamine-hydrolysing)
MTSIDLRDSVEALSSSESPSFLAVYRRGGGTNALGLETVGNGEPTAALARDDVATVVFAGTLFDRAELAGRAGTDQSRSDAEIVLAAFRKLGGDGLLRELRGAFALVVHDGRDDTLLFARDQLGHHPLFFAEGRDGLYLSESIATLVRQPAVSDAINRPVVAEILIHRARSADETCFEAVSRARAGWLYRVDRDGRKAARYWFPIDPKLGSDWIREEELGQFGPLMDKAVARAVEPGATGIFLSGGLDSVTVAMHATDLLRGQGESLPVALSIVFPEFDETFVQKNVAETLGLRHELVPYEEASGSDSLVMSAVRTSGTWPQPLVNLWQPLYTHLAMRARANGLRRVLTGAGGDEWLQVTPQWGFSRLRRLHVREMHHLYRTYLQSYNLKRGPLLKNLLWKYGLYYTLRNAALSGLDKTVPGRAQAVKLRRFRESRPDWLAPDPVLSEEVEQRAGLIRPIEAVGTEFASDNFPFLENPIGAMEREEAFERGRRLGVETFMPFWDADLDAFLARVPPHLMNQDYWSKGLVRSPLAARFPAAGFQTQKKVLSTTLSTRLMSDQTPHAWRKMGGVPALRAAGIVDEKVLQSDVERRLEIIKRPDVGSEGPLARSIAAHGIWTVLNVESWLRQWV